MATIKFSDLAPITDVDDSEMSLIELTEQELESVVGGQFNAGDFAILRPFHNQPENYVVNRPGTYSISRIVLGGSTGPIGV
jgi:hypothetical protein